MVNIPADLILCNARVITFDKENLEAEIVAIKGDKILAATKKYDIESFIGPDTRLIDCHGMTVIPGFNDAHCHPVPQAITFSHIDCSPSAVKSIDDIKKQIRKHARLNPGGKWLRAAQYNEIRLVEKRHPTRWELDEAAPDHPVILVHYSAGTCVLNSMALRLVGINRDTPDTPGGRIGREPSTGEPNGIIFGVNDHVQKGIPPADGAELEKGIKLVSQQYLSRGVTSLQDTGWNNGLIHWQTYLRFKSKEGLLPNRVSMLIGTDALKEIIASGLSMGSGDNQLRIGGVKIALDESTGCIHPPQHDLNFHALQAHQAGFQLAFHVHDLYHLRAALAAMNNIRRETTGPIYRHRLEHCMVCTPDLLELMMEIPLVVVTQPSFLHYGVENFMDAIPPEKLHCLFPIASFNHKGLAVAFSSDAPMMPVNPLTDVYTAVTRKGFNGRVLAPEEGISPLEALKIYTLGSAYAALEEGIKGSLTPGKLADIVVLNNDPNQVEPEAIKDILVMMTMINGKIVWER